MLTRRKAFTTIEILLVVGVLIILIGIVVWGLKGAAGGAGVNATRATLQNLSNISEEFNRKTKLSVFEGTIYAPPAVPGPFEIAPGLVTADSKNADRLSPAIERTSEVMNRLMSIPDNKRIVEKIPSDQTMAIQLADGHERHIVLLDGWKNPILYVPATGLAFVAAKEGTATTASSGTNYARGARVIARSKDMNPSRDAVYWTAINATTTIPPSADWFEGIRSPDGRPFWASAGPDGAFGAPVTGPGSVKTAGSGDDNIYSFEQ
jgi:type II secretory pathway pseudopilin PulG